MNFIYFVLGLLTGLVFGFLVSFALHHMLLVGIQKYLERIEKKLGGEHVYNK